MSYDPKDVHRMDQLSGAIRQIAGAIRNYYNGLVAEGFSNAEAMVLTMGFQNTYVKSLLSPKGGATDES